MSQIYNVILPKVFTNRIRHWGAKQFKEICVALFDYAFEGKDNPVFSDKWDDDTIAEMTETFNVTKDYIKESQKRFNIKQLTNKKAL